jgi:hypothetical protein
VSQADSPNDPKPTTNASDDAVRAIEAKREALERLAKSDYSLAEEAEALLEIADSHN